MFLRSVVDSNRKVLLAAVAVLAVLTMVPPLAESKYYISLVVQCLIWALFAMSLDLLVGHLGHASLGHAAFFGGASYALAVFNVRLRWDFLSSSAAALVFTILLAAIFGLLVSHVTGISYALVNFALAQVVWGLAYQWNAVSGGDNGIRGISRPVILGIDFGSIYLYYYFVLAVFVVCTIFLLLIVSSPFGMSIKGIKQSQSRMRVLGYNVWLHKYICFIIAGAFAGIAGIMEGGFASFVGPTDVGMLTSAKALLMVLVGGPGSIVGPIFGAVAVVLLENIVGAFTDRWLIVLGLVYVAVVIFLPGGIIKLTRLGPKATPALEDVPNTSEALH